MFGLLACERAEMRAVAGDIAVAPAGLHFQQWVGFPASRPLTLKNTSRADRTVTLATAPPFSVEGALTVPGGVEVTFPVSFDPSAAGSTAGSLTVSDGENVGVVALDGTAVVPPVCAPSASCRTTAFDPVSGTCVESVSADGTACESANACLLGGACLRGACLGSALDCGDSNPCTVDSCEPATGCLHEAVRCAAPMDPCKVARCEPLLGCVEVDAADGTACGPADCVTAKVCLLGQCKSVAVPDGAVCADATACQGQGVCRQQRCDRPAATPLTGWSQLGEQLVSFRGVSDSSQNLYWVECAVGGIAGAWCMDSCTLCAVTSVTKNGGQRFQAVLGGPPDDPQQLPHLLAGAHFVYALKNSVGSVSTADGAAQWSVPLLASMPGAPDYANFFGVRALAADSGGAVYLTIARWFQGGVDAVLARQNLLLKIDSSNGAVLLTRYYDSDLSGPVLDEHDNLYLGLVAHTGITAVAPVPQLLSLDPAGVERWRAPVTSSPTPLAAYHGEVTLQGGEVRAALDGTWRAAAPPGGLLRNALMSSTARTLLHQFQGCSCCETCGEVCDCAPQPPTVTALALPPGGTTPWWEVPVATPTGLSITLSDSVATAAGDTLVAVAASPPWPPAGLPGPMTALLGLTSSGATRFSCVLPPTPQPFGSGGGSTFSSAVALLDGRWAVVETIQCNTCVHNPAPRVRVFDLPGEAPATHGWVGAYGGPSGASRPLP